MNGPTERERELEAEVQRLRVMLDDLPEDDEHAWQTNASQWLWERDAALARVATISIVRRIRSVLAAGVDPKRVGRLRQRNLELEEPMSEPTMEALHWSFDEDDECIEDCPGCLREQVIQLVARADDGYYGQVGEPEATQMVDLLIAAMFDQSARLAAPVSEDPEGSSQQ